MLDMAAGLAPAIVAQQFRDPCTIPTRRTEFDFVMPNEGSLDLQDAKVTGSAIRQGTTIRYQVRADAGSRGGVIDARGIVQFSARIPVPETMLIDGWDVGIPDREGTFRWAKIERENDWSTIADLYRWRPAP